MADADPQPGRDQLARIIAKLSHTWPARLAKDAWSAVTLPGDVAQGKVEMWKDGHTNPEVINRSAELAGLMAGGGAGTGARAGETTLGSGFVGRKLPADNYTGPVSRYTDELFREMSPREALEGLPTSVASGSQGLGNGRKFYADQPELALGQGQNRGVRVTYDAEPFVGQINKKPGWEALFPEGRAEYTAAPTKNIRETVRGFEIDTSTLNTVEKAQYQRLLSNLEQQGWDISRAEGQITARRPGKEP